MWRRPSKFGRPAFTRAFDALSPAVRDDVRRKIDELGTRLADYSHQRLAGRSECKLRVGNYRVLYEFDAKLGRLYLHYVGHRREIYKRS